MKSKSRSKVPEDSQGKRFRKFSSYQGFFFKGTRHKLTGFIPCVTQQIDSRQYTGAKRRDREMIRPFCWAEMDIWQMLESSEPRHNNLSHKLVGNNPDEMARWAEFWLTTYIRTFSHASLALRWQFSYGRHNSKMKDWDFRTVTKTEWLQHGDRNDMIVRLVRNSFPTQSNKRPRIWEVEEKPMSSPASAVILRSCSNRIFMGVLFFGLPPNGTLSGMTLFKVREEDAKSIPSVERQLLYYWCWESKNAGALMIFPFFYSQTC